MTTRTDAQGSERRGHILAARSGLHDAFDDDPEVARVENRQFSYRWDGKKCVGVQLISVLRHLLSQLLQLGRVESGGERGKGLRRESRNLLDILTFACGKHQYF